MRFIRNIFNRLSGTIILIATILLLQSCEYINDDVSVSTRKDMHLSLVVMTSSAQSTRADNNRDDDWEERGNNVENYIDFAGGDCKIVLFDADGNFLLELDGKDIPSVATFEDENNTYYKIELDLEFPESTLQTTKDKIFANGLKVMVLSNWKSVGKDYSDFNANLSSIWNNNTDFNYFYRTSPKNGTSPERESWLPDMNIEPKTLIPMFGFANTSKFQNLDSRGFRTDVVIPMQRVMAKIEVIDGLPDNQDGVRINSVRMSQYNTYGRLIPDVESNPSWDQIGSQVTSSSLPQNITPSNNLYFIKEGNKWVAYVPEMRLSPDGNTELSDNRTHLDISLEVDDKRVEEFLGSLTYTAHFAQYNESTSTPSIPDDTWNHILRNHIYRFYVRSVGFNLELEMHVVPWTLDEDEDWDFTDHVSISKMLDWNINSYESLDTETGRLLLWIDDDKDKILTGSFIIKTPVNGRWYARLTPLDDAKPNAITFVDSNGATMEPSYGDPPVCLEISGVIEQEVPAYIRIRPTDFGNDDMSAFKLEFFVENLGVWINVPMVKDEYEFPYYIIVRKGNKIDY